MELLLAATGRTGPKLEFQFLAASETLPHEACISGKVWEQECVGVWFVKRLQLCMCMLLFHQRNPYTVGLAMALVFLFGLPVSPSGQFDPRTKA